jgi:hypothetical protein
VARKIVRVGNWMDKITETFSLILGHMPLHVSFKSLQSCLGQTCLFGMGITLQEFF